MKKKIEVTLVWVPFCRSLKYVLSIYIKHFAPKIFFKDPKDTPPPTRVETREERLERRRRERAEQVAYKLEQEIAVWDPNSMPIVTGDPFKTLFVARIVSNLSF